MDKNSKKIIVGVVLLALLVACFAIGVIIAPYPKGTTTYVSTKCVDLNGTAGLDSWYYLTGFEPYELPNKDVPCYFINSTAAKRKEGLTPENLVFTVQMSSKPLDKNLQFSHWQHKLVGVLTANVAYSESRLARHDIPLVIEARIGYRDQDDPQHEWKEYGSSLFKGNLNCQMDGQNSVYHYNCSSIPFFKIGPMYHDHYLLNFRFPLETINDEGETVEVEHDLGWMSDFKLTTVYQNGGFMRIMVSLRTIFLALILMTTLWFCYRLRMLDRRTTVVEKMLTVLSGSLILLDTPLEFATQSHNIPWMELLNDVKLDIFYTALMIFCSILAIEHFANDIESRTNPCLNCWMSILIILIGSTSLGCFSVYQYLSMDPFPWLKGPADEGMGKYLQFVIAMCSLSAIFFIFICFMSCRIYITKKEPVNYCLMFITLVVAAMTVIDYILQQVSNYLDVEGGESVFYISGFLTGVYGMWNVYVMGLLFFFAPSGSNDDQQEVKAEEMAHLPNFSI